MILNKRIKFYFIEHFFSALCFFLLKNRRSIFLGEFDLFQFTT